MSTLNTAIGFKGSAYPQNSNIYIGAASNAQTITVTATQVNNAYYDYFRRVRKRYLLEIGKVYLISYAPEKIRKAKFIRSTPKGFNFVDVETKKLLFKKHIYRCRHQDYDGYNTQTVKDDFWVWMVGNINVALPLEEQEIVTEEN